MNDKQKPEFVTRLAGMVQDTALCMAVDAEVTRQLDMTKVIELVVARVIEQLVEDGFCSFDWHVSKADEFFPDGRCCSCGKQLAEHATVPVCSFGETAEEGAHS